MIKHRLLLSAAAAALLAAALADVPALADTRLTTNTSTELSTSTAGNIIIDNGGGISISKSATPAITLNSANSVLNNGGIANAGVDTGVGVLIDTTAGSILSSGFSSTGTIDVGGNGTAKRGVVIQGGNTFYGPISLTTLFTTALTGATAATQGSSIIVQGDGSAAFLLVQGTTVTSNILIGGSGIVQNASENSTVSNSIMVDLEGALNGNLLIQSSLSGVGAGLIGVQTLGGIHSCASVTSAPSGFTCPTSSGGSLVVAGTISLIGTNRPNIRGGNPQAGSAVVIGGNVDGGFVLTGPGTSSNVNRSLLSSTGLIVSGVAQPVVLIDPNRSATGGLTAPRGPVILGPVTSDIDSIDPGYSFINRGQISAQPTDANLSTAGVIIQGASSANFTCLGTVSGGVCNTTGGGLLNTGAILVQANTNTTSVPASGIITATGLYVGAFATVPRLDVTSEAINASNSTAGTINAVVNGLGQGSAFGIILGAGSNVPEITVSRGAQITARVLTSTISPTKNFATATSPFSLVSEAILDQGGSLKTINNSGTIQAENTLLIPATGAVTSSITDAIDLSAGTTGGVTINNSGHILGNILMSAAGNGNVLNVGNTGNGGINPNPGTGFVNTPTNYAVVAQSIIADAVGLPPLTVASTLSFGSGTNHLLHVGGFGYVNAIINSGVNSLAVQVDPNGQLFISNTTSSVQATTFNVASNGTLGLAISQANLNSLTPVVQANSANLSGANLALQFGTYISSGFTAASTANPTSQTITLIRAPVITDTTILSQNALLGQNTPFLFETPTESGVAPLSINNDPSGQQTLLLHLLPRSTGARNADGSPGLNLSGDAKNVFPFAAAALSTDLELGSAIATSMTVYNTPGVPGSGINIPASQQQAQRVFSQLTPDVSGGTREIAIMLTDQASGPVAARQRLLRSYANVAGDTTLWGEEFTGQINNKGRVASDGTLTAYKDHGFGFVLGLDGGSPRNGWYGGAFTFFTGDVTQQLPRATRTNTEWYMLTGYTQWRGKHVFLDTQLSAAYGDFNETRTLDIGGVFRSANSRRPGAMVALGANTGAMLKYGGIEVDPHISLDGMTMREEGYRETGGGAGLNLDVAPFFASSLRTGIGADFKTKIAVWNFDLTPEMRVGYRYDLLTQPVKIKAAFQSLGGRSVTGNTITFVGPDPDSGNAIVGLGLGASTDTWHLGVNYDWIRGNNGSVTQVGMLSVLGRI